MDAFEHKFKSENDYTLLLYKHPPPEFRWRVLLDYYSIYFKYPITFICEE